MRGLQSKIINQYEMYDREWINSFSCLGSRSRGLRSKSSLIGLCSLSREVINYYYYYSKRF